MGKKYPLFKYTPSLAAAVLFCIVFLIISILHLYQMIKKKTWFLIPLVIGGFFEFTGYACRSASASQPKGEYTLMPFVVQNSYILLAPALFAATIYMTLGRVIRLTDGDKYSIVGSRKLTWFFLGGDIFCFVMQGGGGSLVAIGMRDPTKSSLAKAGNNIALAGIILQTIWFIFFVIGIAFFHKRMAERPTAHALSNPEITWKKWLYVLYLVSGLVLVRSVFRLVEFAQGIEGAAQKSEALFYVFDSVMMGVLLGVLNWQHPGEIGVLLRIHGLKSGGEQFGQGLRSLA